MSEDRSMGQSLLRVDAIAKVTGAARYVADIVLPGMLHMKVLRSTLAHGRIMSLDVRRAQEHPGVMAVVTGQSCPQLVGSCIFDQPPMALDRVRFVGEPVAAVVAEAQDAALGALELIEVDYEPLPAVLDPRQAMSAAAPRLHPQLGDYRCAPSFHPQPGTNIFHRYRLRKGSLEEGFQQADVVEENRFHFPHIAHAQLEPHGAIALWERDGQLTVWTSAQSPFFVRNSLATTFGLSHASVRVICPYLGGGFGGKSDVTIEPLVACAARAVPGRSVRLVLTREEMFAGTVLGRGCWATIRTGVRRDGTIVAEEIELIFGSGAYGDHSINIVEGAGHNATGPYRIPHLKVDSYGVYTNTPPVGAYRGYGHPEVHWMAERQMDLIAQRLEMDPVELRRRNILRPGDVNAFGQVMDEACATFSQCIDRVAQELNTGASSGDAKETGHLVTGTGLAAFMKSPVMSTTAASGAIIKFGEDGSVNVLVGCTEMGQGSFTAMTQLAAEALKVPVDKIRVRQVIDTDVCPYEWQTVASTTTWKVGNAIARAARDAVGRMKQTAAQLWGVHPDEVEHGLERVFLKRDPSTQLSFSQLAMGAKGPLGEAVGAPVTGSGWFLPQGLTDPDPQTGQGNLAAEWTFGCQGAEVAVDLRTGDVRVLRLITAIDAGRIVNPELARGQVVGAMVTGLGATLSEQVVYSPDGRIRNDSLTDYKVPTPGDVMDIHFRVIFLVTPLKESDFGVRPLAEHGTVSVAPAIANAIARATGIQFTDLPMTAERVREHLRSGENI